MWDAMLIWIRNHMLRFFDIRLGEGRRVLIMQLNIFLIIQCLWIIKPVANAQFLSRVGIEKLPLVFVLVAITALIVTTAYAYLQGKMPLNVIITQTYLLSMIILVSIGLLLKFQLFEDWMSYVFYIGVALFGLITTSQFWLLSNIVFSTLEAKRLFGFVGAGAIAGGISGGYLTSLLAPVMNSEILLFIASGMIFIILLNNVYIWKNIIPSPELNKKQVGINTEFPFKLVRNSKLLTHLALIMGISVLVAKLVEYQFSAIASERIKDPDQLTAFFGFWFSTSNMISLVIQLLIMRRIVRRVGVGKSLLILPGTLFAGAAAVLYAPVLWAGTTLKVIDISLKQSINKAATELLIMPVPMEIKNRVKTFIDVFVDTTATGIGGIILIFLINTFNLPVQAVSGITLLFIVCWIYLAIRARKEYSMTFMEKLRLPKQSTLKTKEVLSEENVFEGIQKALNSGSVRQILFLLARIEENKDSTLMKDVIPLLRHELPIVRQAALKCLYYYNDHSIIPQIKPLLKDKDDEVRSRAFACLLSHTRQDRIQFIEDYLTDPDPNIRGAALVGLATEARDNPKMQNYFHLSEKIFQVLQLAKQSHDPEWIESSKILVARAIGYGKLESEYHILMDFLKDSNPVVVKHAILAAGSTGNPGMIKILLRYLGIKSARDTAQKSLSRFQDFDMLKILTEYREQNNISREILIRLPSFAEKVNSQQSIDYLFSFLQHPDHIVKQKALQSLLNVQTRFPYLNVDVKKILVLLEQEAQALTNNLHLLSSAQCYEKEKTGNSTVSVARAKFCKALQNNSGQLIKNIFLEMALVHTRENLLLLYEGSRHKNPDTRMDTLELLDNILEPGIKNIIFPVLETALLTPQQQNIDGVADEKMFTEFEVLETILKSQNIKLKIKALTLIEALDKPDFNPMLEAASHDKNPDVSKMAQNILTKG